jgi:hypothetical protein
VLDPRGVPVPDRPQGPQLRGGGGVAQEHNLGGTNTRERPTRTKGGLRTGCRPNTTPMPYRHLGFKLQVSVQLHLKGATPRGDLRAGEGALATVASQDRGGEYTESAFRGTVGDRNALDGLHRLLWVHNSI